MAADGESLMATDTRRIRRPVAGLCRWQTSQRLSVAARVGSSDSITAVDLTITLRFQVHRHRLSYRVAP
jgi:hypothetical protein